MIKQTKEIVEWANEIFPDRTIKDTCAKLLEETLELYTKPDDPMEYADVMIVLLDIANRHGITWDNIVESVEEKMSINRNRSWRNVNGVMKHEQD